MTAWEERKRGDTAGFVIVAILLLGAGVWGVMHLRPKDPGTLGMQSAIGRSMAKLAAALNPQLELVTFDQPPGTISMRDRASGKPVILRYRLDRDKHEFVVSSPDGTIIRFQAGAPGASSLELRSKDFLASTGKAAERATGWIPLYPGAAPSTMSSITAQGAITHTYWFDTQDSMDKVRSVYSELFKRQGFTAASAAVEPGVLAAETDSGKRGVQIRMTKKDAGTHVIVYAVEKP